MKYKSEYKIIYYFSSFFETKWKCSLSCTAMDGLG